ncbi:hypothetical protein M422DRAFT_215866 [Sphaerobolus stellatus SS14]|uniref:Unplaced genomic scaffold SPHSTscaffold_262, whole genome shotgun sequence n=1 Tax=Sphaerobolus stellatus (strain SS14) TaxID=990650 RepID=A0A0C9U090_SPHS4|nr:hypothetical protein M422DRAFT_215866 [Sphaerobolus stellatus SS14]
MAVLSSPLQWISSTPPATRTFTALLITTSGIYYWLQWRQFQETSPTGQLQVPYLTLVPGTSWIYPWTLLTSSFVEKTVIELAFSLICLPVSLRYLERLWGTTETFKFIGVTLIVSNIITLIVSWFEYFVLGMELFIYGMEYHGQMALQTGVLVAFTQMIPEHQVQVFGIIKMRVKRLPMAYVTFSTIMCFVGFQDPFIIIQFGWLVAWFYLRFYKRTGGEAGGPVEWGDRSETFAFIYWFPPFLHYPIGIASNIVYNLALRLKLVMPHSGSAGDLEGGYSALPGGARAEAERRRALALKALDQRLANPATNPGGAVSSPTSGPSDAPEARSQPPRQPGHHKSPSKTKVSHEIESEGDIGVAEKAA